MASSIYRENGYENRSAYLQSLAEENDVHIDMVLAAAEILGPNEDFDGLVSNVEDYSCFAHV